MLEVVVESMSHSQCCKDRIVHKRRPQVRERSRRVFPRVFVKMSGDQIVQHGIAEKLEPLVTLCEPVREKRGMGERLKKNVN